MAELEYWNIGFFATCILHTWNFTFCHVISLPAQIFNCQVEILELFILDRYKVSYCSFWCPNGGGWGLETFGFFMTAPLTVPVEKRHIIYRFWNTCFMLCSNQNSTGNEVIYISHYLPCMHLLQSNILNLVSTQMVTVANTGLINTSFYHENLSLPGFSSDVCHKDFFAFC